MPALVWNQRSSIPNDEKRREKKNTCIWKMSCFEILLKGGTVEISKYIFPSYVTFPLLEIEENNVLKEN